MKRTGRSVDQVDSVADFGLEGRFRRDPAGRYSATWIRRRIWKRESPSRPTVNVSSSMRSGAQYAGDDLMDAQQASGGMGRAVKGQFLADREVALPAGEMWASVPLPSDALISTT